jgi:hypothetical protein
MPGRLRVMNENITWVGQIERKRVSGNQDICRRMPAGCGNIKFVSGQ